MANITFSKLEFGHRRAVYLDIKSQLDSFPVPEETIRLFEDFDMIYRSLCGILYNFAPKSGHPGGSISSGRIVSSLLFNTMDYDFSDPECPEADIISYAAGHKAMGLYAMWALRNECARISRPDLMAEDNLQLRLEDLLGFRRNPTQETPLFSQHRAKALDGHPSPITPFIKISTGASGVGVPTTFGLSLGAMDMYGADSPFVHAIEGEGGMTAGRVSEALATMATAQMWNTRLHLDWNQASIDSDFVCRDGDEPGDYVQWDPAELCYLQDWNVIFVENGHDAHQVLAAQEAAKERINDQPTAIIYRTVKGWCYGIEGRKSHGAGHDFCSEEYHETLDPIKKRFGVEFPVFGDEPTPTNVERTFWETLCTLRTLLEENREIPDFFAGRLSDSKDRLTTLNRQKRENAPDLGVIYTDAIKADEIPEECAWEAGSSQTLRGALGAALGHLNKATNGAFIGASADLLDSTSISKLGAGFPGDLYNAVSNPDSRLIAVGGICEDNMGAFMAGLSAFGSHIGAGSSYAAFIASLQHIAARLHGIGQQAHRELTGDPFRPFMIVCGHAGLKTGEDGPTHADPQPLQLLQENFPDGIMITLTPWDPQEIWPMLIAALKKRPAVLAPFVTRPNETIIDRQAAGIPPVTEAANGLYAIRRADPEKSVHHGTLVLQGGGITNTFVTEVLPRIDGAGYNMNIYYVTSAELFSMLSEDEQEAIFPEALAGEAMGLTGFTLPTMYRWVTSNEGRKRTVHAFHKGHFLGSGQAHKVFEEAGLDGDGQWTAIVDYATWMENQE